MRTVSSENTQAFLFLIIKPHFTGQELKFHQHLDLLQNHFHLRLSNEAETEKYHILGAITAQIESLDASIKIKEGILMSILLTSALKLVLPATSLAPAGLFFHKTLLLYNFRYHSKLEK